MKKKTQALTFELVITTTAPSLVALDVIKSTLITQGVPLNEIVQHLLELCRCKPQTNIGTNCLFRSILHGAVRHQHAVIIQRNVA